MRVRALVPFSLVRGGPIYRLWRRIRLVRHDGPDALRLGLALVASLWVPMVLIALLERAITGAWPLLFQELSVHARLLIALPLLAVAEEWSDALTRRALRDLGEAKIMQDEPAFLRICATARRMRDSWIVELSLLGVAFATTYAAVWGLGPWRSTAFFVPASSGSATLLWYGIVALPIAQWLAYRWVWRWIIWCYVLVGVSRSPLRLDPAHPDRACGLRVFADAVLGFVPVATAVAWVMAGAWATRILHGGAHLPDFAPSLSVLIAVTLVVLLGPLVVFSPGLVRARLQARLQYGRLAGDFVLLFRQRWIEQPHGPKMLESPTFEAMASITEIYDGVARTRSVPFGPRTVVTCLVSLLTSLLPLAIADHQLREILLRIAEVAIGKLG